jgi:2-hydroxy-3-keto-5-methylthiopentenyl-1-phosphate phosphatase
VLLGQTGNQNKKAASKGSSDVSSVRMNAQVFIDFDGTLAPGDPTDTLLARFADSSWLELEADFKAGRMTSRECMARQIGLIRATPEDYDALVGDMSIDPHFAAFAEICDRNAIPMTIVSDGPDRSIEILLRKAGLDLPYFANKLDWLGGDKWKLGFPHARTDCAMIAGNCKCQFAERFPAATQIMIGDGRSDFCISNRVDLVFAKGALAKHCAANGAPHHVIRDFRDATRLMKDWLDGGIAAADGNSMEFRVAAA